MGKCVHPGVIEAVGLGANHPRKLDSFIAKPDEVVPGNSMNPYGGLASAEDRSKLIAFLQSPGTN
jgi:cytochrome c2